MIRAFQRDYITDSQLTAGVKSNIPLNWPDSMVFDMISNGKNMTYQATTPETALLSMVIVTRRHNC